MYKFRRGNISLEKQTLGIIVGDNVACLKSPSLSSNLLGRRQVKDIILVCLNVIVG